MRSKFSSSLARALACALTLAGLGGCVSLSQDHGFKDVAKTTGERLERAPIWARDKQSNDAIQTLVRELTARPLSPDDAVHLALINNRELQAMYASLGVAEADVVQAGRLPNPTFGTTRTRSDESFKYETSFTLPVVALLTMPSLLRIERARYESVKLEVTDRVLKVAHDVRAAYFDVLAAEENLRYRKQVEVAAEASAELAKRMRAAGNFAKLDELRERAFLAEVAAELAKHEAQVVVTRERLLRLVGLDPAKDRFEVPERMPDLPASLVLNGEQLEAFALEQRVDIAATKRNAAAVAASLGLTKSTRFVNVLELGPATLMEKSETIKKGYALSVELPLFDWGSARVARAEARYMQAVQQASQVALDAQSEVRASIANYQRWWEAARIYRDQLVPLRKQVSDEYMLRYNGMLVSVFELIADARDQIAAVNQYISALREFWQADAQLRMSLGGALPRGLASNTVPAPVPRQQKDAPQADEPHDHSKHHEHK